MDEEVSLSIYAWLFEKKDILFISIVVFLQPAVKRPSAMVYILSNFENSENIYKEVTSQMTLSVKRCLIYYKNTLLLCLKNATYIRRFP